MSTSLWGAPQSHARTIATAMPAGGGHRGEGSILGPLGGFIQGNS